MKSIKGWQRPDEGKLDRLPKWAKSYISLLEMRLSEQEQLVEAAVGDGLGYSALDDSKVYLQLGGDELYREVPVRSRMRFPAGKGFVAEVRVDRHGGESVEVTLSGGIMSIVPQVSNVVRVSGVKG